MASSRGTARPRKDVPDGSRDATAAPGGEPLDSPATDIEARWKRIAIAAYFRAERCNFEGEGQLDDWLEAEREIDSLKAAGDVEEVSKQHKQR